MKKQSNLDDDLVHARNNLYELSKLSMDAIEIMMSLAKDSESPRAMEVLANMLKQQADLNTTLVDLHKKEKDIRRVDPKDVGPALPGPTTNTQNNLYVGTTAELQKMLIEKMDSIKNGT